MGIHQHRNAPKPLLLRTPDTNELVHPDVIHIPERFGGYAYWMAFTPYPLGNDRYENPCLRASVDGYVWIGVPGSSDPLIAAPTEHNIHHADPELVFSAGKLYLVYMTRDKTRKETRFSFIASSDGVAWSDPEVFYRANLGVSPSIAVCDDTWSLWTILLDTSVRGSNAQLIRLTGPELTNLRYSTPCTINIEGFVPWHIDVLRVNEGYEALIAAFPRAADMSHTRLFHVRSMDGIDFVPTTSRPIISPSLTGWDNRMIYRSTFLRRADGSYRIWYSASNWSRHYGIGYLEGQLGELKSVQWARTAPTPSVLPRLAADAAAFIKYHATQRLPPRLLNTLRRVRATRRD